MHDDTNDIDQSARGDDQLSLCGCPVSLLRRVVEATDRALVLGEELARMLAEAENLATTVETLANNRSCLDDSGVDDLLQLLCAMRDRICDLFDERAGSRSDDWADDVAIVARRLEFRRALLGL